ncbi:hypothetical protein [Embleya sp. NBC_00896]|uniref:hypothetical protein n=1 Tax=Embleya sp. NBC_00896 TaxID=2975961 RepID=UPI00386D52EF|nr:hypothetical protein OG928_09890 [Embleya sp. NBC_00896]
MPRKGVTRGDLIVAVAAIGVLVFSFLPWYSVTVKGKPPLKAGTTDYSAWVGDFWPLAPAVVLLSSISLVLLLIGRYTFRAGAAQPTEIQFGGLSFRQWGIALGVASAWSAVWAVFGADGGYEKLAEAAERIARAGDSQASIEGTHGWGSWGLAGFAVLQGLLLLVADRIGGLNAPLVRARENNAWQGYPGGGFPGAPGGYPPGPPGTGGFAVPPPVAPPVYGPSGNTPPPQTPPMAQPPAVQPPVLYKSDTPVQGQPAVHTPEPTPEPERLSTDPGTFEQYWLAVPEQRALQPSDHIGDAVATLHPGVWYLAVGVADDGIVIDIDGLQGVLRDLTGIQRGE